MTVVRPPRGPGRARRSVRSTRSPRRPAPTTSTTSSRSRRERDSDRAGPSSKGGSPWTPPIVRRTGFRRVGMRPMVLFLVLVLLALAAVAVISVGSRNRAAPPFGPGGQREHRVRLRRRPVRPRLARSRAATPDRRAGRARRRALLPRRPADRLRQRRRRSRQGDRRQRRRLQSARSSSDEPFTGDDRGVVAGQPIHGAHDHEGRRTIGTVDRGGRRIGRPEVDGRRTRASWARPTTRRTTAPC